MAQTVALLASQMHSERVEQPVLVPIRSQDWTQVSVL
jgi:hypothetical protein